MPWGPLAPILAARGPPRPLPRGLLGSLGVSEDLPRPSGPPGTSVWDDFGAPGTPTLTDFCENIVKIEVAMVF